MSLIRPASLRLSAAIPTRTVALRQARASPVRSHLAIRRYANGTATTTTTTPPPPPPPPPPPASNNNGMYIVLAALAALGAGGYWYLKPVRDVAAMTHQAMHSVREGASTAGDSIGDLSGIAKAFLPPTAFMLYDNISRNSGGINGFITQLKDKDLQGVIDEVKKVGGDDVKRIMEKVEKKVKDANGKVQDVDWRALAVDLKKELPASQQHYVDMLIGKIPTKEDVDNLIKKAKDVGEEQLKEVEKSASKIMAAVDKAKKDGKSQADAYLTGLKAAAPADVDQLIKQLKEAAKKAGLPADQAEAWLRSKADDGKVNADDLAKNLEDKLRTAQHFIPGNPKDLIKQVEQFSPSVAKLLTQALEHAGITDAQGNRK